MINPDDYVGGKYRIVRRLGAGGMGTVYEAVQLKLGRRVALKIMHPYLATNVAGRERFIREARALARLSHENIARIFDFDELGDGDFYLVMEFLDGRDLRAEFKTRGPLPIDEAVGYVTQACAGIAETHRHGIIHRDIKPENLFITGLGGNRTIKLVDFGLAKTQTDTALTVQPAGTRRYMAPELFRLEEASARSDLWALGIMLHELVTGVSPFQRADPAQTIRTLVQPQGAVSYRLEAGASGTEVITLSTALGGIRYFGRLTIRRDGLPQKFASTVVRGRTVVAVQKGTFTYGGRYTITLPPQGLRLRR